MVIKYIVLLHNNEFSFYLYLQIKREKTSKSLFIPLLPRALTIMNEYNNDDFVFPGISNQRYNSYLKKIANIVGIDKRLTTHMDRRTFATMVLLYNDVPMEMVSELLGYSSAKITQDNYAKILKRKVSMAVNRISK